MSVFDVADLPRPIIRYGVGLWRRRWSVIVATWMGALALWAAVWLIPDRYESRAQVFVQTETLLDPVMSGVTARPNYERRVEIITLQLLTRPNIERVIYRAGLDKEIKASTEYERRAKLEKMIDWVAGQVKIESPQEMYFVIRYKHGDPVMARDVVDALLNMLIEQDLGASLTESEDARRRLDREIELFDQRLTEREREIAEFRRINGEELALVQGNLRQREQKEQDLSRIADELSLAERRVISLEGVLSSTPRTSSGNELDKLLVELAALRSQYEEDHPDIRMVKARIAELSGSGGATLPTNPEHTRIRSELRAARDTVASLLQRREALKGELEALEFTIGEAPAAQADLQRLERDYDQQRKNYEELLQRRDRLSLTLSLGAGGKGVEYQVHERPVAALSPVSPPRLVLILGAFVVALGAGLGLAALQTFLQKTFSQASELQEAFGLPVLGALSEARSADVHDARRHDLRRMGLALGALAVVGACYAWLDVFRPLAFADIGAQSARAAWTSDGAAAVSDGDVR